MTNPDQSDETEWVWVRDRPTTRHRPGSQRYGRWVEMPKDSGTTENEN